MVRDILVEAFGDVKVEQEKEFIHTGIKHTRVEDGSSPSGAAARKNHFHYILGQNEYAVVAKPVSVPELMNAKVEDGLFGHAS